MLHTTTTTRNVPGHITRTYTTLASALKYGDEQRAAAAADMLLHPANREYITLQVFLANDNRYRATYSAALVERLVTLCKRAAHNTPYGKMMAQLIV